MQKHAITIFICLVGYISAARQSYIQHPVMLRIGVAKYAIIINSVHKTEISSSAILAPRYKKWQIDSLSVLKVIGHARRMTASEWDARFSVLPCAMSGKLTAGGKCYTYHINAGAYMIVTDDNENYWYDCSAKCCSDLFLELPVAFN